MTSPGRPKMVFSSSQKEQDEESPKRAPLTRDEERDAVIDGKNLIIQEMEHRMWTLEQRVFHNAQRCHRIAEALKLERKIVAQQEREIEDLRRRLAGGWELREVGKNG